MKHNCVIIGGSAGSFQTIVSLVAAIPSDYTGTIILCLHRLKHVRSGFVEALSIKTHLPIVEPTDKAPIESGKIYLAPANYHLLIGNDNCFALSTSKAVNHSRPAIDLTFTSAAHFIKDNAIGILLSGANRDGAKGLSRMQEAGAITVVQHPDDAQVSAMPQAALSLMKPDYLFSKDEIIDYLVRQEY